MNILVKASVFILATLPFTDTFAAKSIDVYHFQNEFEDGIKAIKSEKFDKAFQHIERSSKLGNKLAQYELALLYAQGLGTKQDFLQAYIWLNVASEVKEKRWNELLDKISKLFTNEQKATFQPLVNEYISNYGEKSQEVICRPRATIGSNVKYMFCEKLLDSGQVRIRTK